jgi:two-component system, NtrC family, response regulator HydG
MPNMTATANSETAVHSLDEPLDVCILDDDPSAMKMLEDTLRHLGFAPVGTSNPREVLEEISRGRFRVVLCDIKMATMDGLTFIEHALRRNPGVYVIIITGYCSLESAVGAIKRGAYDYLPKPPDQARLKRTLTDIAEQILQRSRIRDLDKQLLQDIEFHGIIGRSQAMLDVFDLARKVAQHDTNVLLIGQTGTGKELIAHAIHQLSPVAGQNFAVCNCATMEDTLLESQLFGHASGAFTGANETRPGLFEYANGGTVFLDEVGGISVALQAKLLRVIQNREIQRVGSPEVRRVEMRLIAATNRDLRAEVLAGNFRKDLFYHLSTVQIRVPSLSERLEDIPLLVAFFLRKYNKAYQKQIQGLTRRAQSVLLQHTWPGNVRELENLISSAAFVAVGDFIDVGDLPEHMQKSLPRDGADSWRPLPLDQMRREYINRVLHMCGGNRVRAAQLLGIGRSSLYRFLKQERSIISSPPRDN